jgi:hypothetical protein
MTSEFTTTTPALAHVYKVEECLHRDSSTYFYRCEIGGSKSCAELAKPVRARFPSFVNAG